jgi:23S rRNA (guanosine2251-2'-O)-methyltransferase
MLSVCLDNLRSAYNVGSIFRTCDTLGVDKIYLCGLTPIPLNQKLQKTALGSLASVSWEHHCQTVALLKFLKSKSSLIAFEVNPKAKSIYQYNFSQSSCLIFGNEISGLESKILDLCDDVVSIPQFGVKESLNVASAAAIGLYEYRREHPKI